MKTKTHNFNRAMALCAVAVFSFATVRAANAFDGVQSGWDGSASTEPVSYRSPMPSPGTDPIAPSTDSNNVVDSGSFSGTVMVD